MLSLQGSSEKVLNVVTYYYGNSFVFQLPNKHFIVNDGGNSGDFIGLMTYLKELAGQDENGEQNHVYIDAWVVSHQHGDHFSAITGFCSTGEDNVAAAEGVTVEGFYINEPTTRVMDWIYYDSEKGAWNRQGSIISNQHCGMRAVTTAESKQVPIYNYQTGERYYFNGLVMDVIQSQEMIPVESYGKRNAGAANGTDFNTVSTVVLFTIPATDTSSAHKTFIGGDANDVNMEYVMKMYGDSSHTLDDIEVFVALHHGKNSSYKITTTNHTFTEYLTKNGTKPFDVVLFPCSEYYGIKYGTDLGAFPAAGGENQYIIDNRTTWYAHYGTGNIVVTFNENCASIPANVPVE
jgi:hypothetical protein